MVIATSGSGLANWHNCLDSLCFCLFCYWILYIGSYIFMFLWREKMNILSLFFNIIFLCKLLSFWLKWRLHFPFVPFNLIICTWIFIVIKYQVVRVLPWFNVILYFLEIKLAYYLVHTHFLIVQIVIIISILLVFNYLILIQKFLICVHIWS